jgi:hypothetical protein
MHRSSGMRSISSTLEFGDGLSLAEYDARIQTLQIQLSSYNTLLSRVDEMAGKISLLEQELSIYSEKMLLSVAARYGRDSLQYMQAGGTPRKRSFRAASARPTTPIAPVASTNAEANGKATQMTTK